MLKGIQMFKNESGRIFLNRWCNGRRFPKQGNVR